MKKIIPLLSLLAFQFCAVKQGIEVKLKEYYTTDNQHGKNFIYYYKDINNYFTPFIGTWTYIDGDKTFVVKLLKETKVPYLSKKPKMYRDEINGHYKMIQNYGQPNETVLYTSQINIGTSITPWQTVILASAINNNIMSGVIFDIAGVLNTSYPTGVRGQLVMTINDFTNPLTAHWKVTLPMGMRGTDEPSTFTIPTDIILTKVN